MVLISPADADVKQRARRSLFAAVAVVAALAALAMLAGACGGSAPGASPTGMATQDVSPTVIPTSGASLTGVPTQDPDRAYEDWFFGWYGRVSNHMASMPRNDPLHMTDAERLNFGGLAGDLRRDLIALEAMEPTSRYRQSYFMFVTAMHDFEIMFDEFGKELSAPGSGDSLKAMMRSQSGAALFKQATELYLRESGQDSR